MRFTLRPLTLPALHLRANAQVSLERFDTEMASTFVVLGGGVGFGITDDLEVGLGTSPIAPVAASARTFGVHDGLGGIVRPSRSRHIVKPTLYARYRVIHTPELDLALELAAVLPTENGDPALVLGVPARAFASEHFALDASFSLLLQFRDTEFSDDRVDPMLVLSLMPRYAQENVYFGVDTGYVFDFRDPEFTFIPLMFELGATFPLGTGALDAYARGGFPALFVPGDEDAVLTNYWELTFGVRVQLGLGAR